MLCTSRPSCTSSPSVRKRGAATVKATASRTMRSAEAWPTLSALQATAITRTCAVEIGKLEVDVGAAVGADLDDAGIERHDRLDRRVALHLRAGRVAARAQLAAFGAHAVDQPAIEIADLEAELGLGIEPLLRRRCFELGEVETPRSTAATVMRASSPLFKPSTFTGTVSLVADFTFSGSVRPTFSSRGLWSSPSHLMPTARPGMRFDASSMER